MTKTHSTFAAAGLIAVLAACSNTERAKSEAGDAAAQDAPGPSPRERPAGLAADVSEEITGGNGPFIGAASGLTPPDGFVDEEYVAAGAAAAYFASGTLSDDGVWTFEPGATAAYRTRVLVRRPEKAESASGTVVVEWLNVSGGVDANPDYASLAEELTRQNHVWVGVSAQLIGVEGGPVLVSAPGGDGIAGKGLKALDPARYGSLNHPGDACAFDIFTQVGRALRKGGANLGGTKPKTVLAVGESQSAFALTTYYDGVQPLTKLFDGFLIHSRGGSSLRLLEVAGTAHADAHLIGGNGASLDCGVPINAGPMHLVAKAAFRSLDTWARTGKAPPTAPRLDMTDAATPDVRRDADGIAMGGV